MSKYVPLFSLFLFFNCSYLQSNETTAPDSLVQHIDTMEITNHTLNPSGLDSFKIEKLKEYARDWDASYFPLPTPAMLKHNPTGDVGYVYISNSFDSLSYKNSTEKEPSAGPPCSWKQKFKSGITYSKSTCLESGTNYTINTHSKDKKTLVRLIDMLFYNSINDWNADSTQYIPFSEKAGAYYAIEKNDAGYYDVIYSYSY